MENYTEVEIRMNEATDKIVDYMYREEDRHFREWLNEEDKKDPIKFINKFKEHIFYSVVVMKYKGNAAEISEWLDNYWEENREPDDEEDNNFISIISISKKEQEKNNSYADDYCGEPGSLNYLLGLPVKKYSVTD